MELERQYQRSSGARLESKIQLKPCLLVCGLYTTEATERMQAETETETSVSSECKPSLSLSLSMRLSLSLTLTLSLKLK
jgi:hypothetical protein